ncbi:MAG TPA: protein-methionine-sulfoxide reductase heme-binding subunit MsrQ [Acidobacteriaceae bacterium]|nr:protein-methionine-sulfoxide reductase heme-binding subunit MsrQ [Acidobacteriaceae bacterium]
MPSRAIPYLKVVVHILCLLPFAYLLHIYRDGQLATFADPVNYITHFTGDWALWLLLVTLAVTPVRRLNRSLGWLIRFRRMLGLYCFFYASLHLATYVFLFSGYDTAAAIAGVQAGNLGEPWRQLVLIWPSMLDDAEKRRFIQVGLAAWLILLGLAVTSPQRVLRAMGGYWWNRLHRLIYAAGILAVIHYWWLVKSGVRTPWKVTAVLAVLLLWRVGLLMGKRVRSAAARRANEAQSEVTARS